MLDISGDPEITIIIPTYNRAELLKSAIQSVIDQNFERWKLIIVDDSSTDHTKDIILKFADPRISYKEIPKLGAAYARNLGVKLAKSKYVTFLDSDDYVYNNWLTSYVEVINNTKAQLVFSGQDYIDDQDLIETKLPKPMGPVFNFIIGRILAGSFIISKQLYENVGGISADLKSGHWTDFSLKLSVLIRKNQVKHMYINSALMAVNVHSGQRIRNNELSKLQGTTMVLNNHYETLLLDENMLRNYLRVVLNISLKQMMIKSFLATLLKYRKFILKYGLSKPAQQTL